MNAVAEKNQISMPKLSFNESYVSGRIDLNPRTFESQGRRIFETRVCLPAPDQYTQPAFVVVQSSRPIGRQGEDFAGVCEVGGYRDSFKDKNQEMVNTARNVLRLVE